jgi:ADP-ribose pyrophosphatase YjhB (NUDIX family)
VREWLVAAGLIEGPEGLLLVQNRRRDGSLDWSPPGGVIEVHEGESVRDGLTREVAEETGLVVTDWDGPVYEVDVVAEGLGWTLHVETYRARSYEGELTVMDPDGIVVDARFVIADEWGRHLDGAHPWVREPIAAFLGDLRGDVRGDLRGDALGDAQGDLRGGLGSSPETLFRYRLDGTPGLFEVVRLHGRADG